jgi:hypothetical protein
MHYARWLKHGDTETVQPSRWHPVETHCDIDGCERPRWARGLCSTHYRRWHQHGDPMALKVPTPGSLSARERFWAKVNKSSECWLWGAGLTREGYGLFASEHGKTVVAHRYAYQITVGPVGDLELDHECHNSDLSCPGGRGCLHRRCVNPAHLTPRPNGEHQKLGWENRRLRRL